MSRQDVIAEATPAVRTGDSRNASGNPGLGMASKTAPRSPIATALIWAAVAAVALMTGLAAAADRFWIGDMITFFRPQLALAVLLALCAAIWLRRFGASAALGRAARCQCAAAVHDQRADRGVRRYA